MPAFSASSGRLRRRRRRGYGITHVPQNGGWIDVNHYDSVRDPVIRRCDTTAPEAEDPQALCSRGPINVQVAPFRFTY
jgi:hypothetical protein